MKPSEQSSMLRLARRISRRRESGLGPALLILSWILACTPPVGAAETAAATGRWRWTFTMPDGTETRPQVRLKQDGSLLTGKSKFRHGSEIPISKGSVDGSRVAFQTVRTVDGRSVTTRYSGLLEGDMIVGKMESNWTGQLESYPWEAKRMQETPEGTWKWKRVFTEKPLELTLKGKLEGDKFTGKVSHKKTSTDVEKGTFKKDIVSFELTTRIGDVEVHSRFEGRVMGDQIEGKERVLVGGREEILPWNPERGE